MSNIFTTEESSQEEFDNLEDTFVGTPKGKRLNKAIQMLDMSFTPIRLQSEFDSVSKSTQYRVIRKANNAVDAFLDALAPGQGEKLRHILINKNQSAVDESRLIQCMRSAIEQSVTKRDAQQLVSVYCGKDDDDKYLFTKEQLLEFFPTITINDIDKGRSRANSNLQGGYLIYGHLAMVF